MTTWMVTLFLICGMLHSTSTSIRRQDSHRSLDNHNRFHYLMFVIIVEAASCDFSDCLGFNSCGSSTSRDKSVCFLSSDVCQTVGKDSMYFKSLSPSEISCKIQPLMFTIKIFPPKIVSKFRTNFFQFIRKRFFTLLAFHNK